MKTQSPSSSLLLTLLLLGCLAGLAHGQSTALTYQGYLANNGDPVEGLQDMAFHLFTGPSGGVPSGAVTNLNVNVAGGLFTTTLNFGAGLFDGTAYWLQISVRPAGMGGGYVTLNPRQPLTPQAYALYAANAGTVTSGNISNPSFFGTTGNTSLFLQVSGQVALRIQPDPAPAGGTSHSFNVIAGYAGNFAEAEVRGATISGGGSADTFSLPVFELPNVVSGDFGTISGGLGNRSEGFAASIGGGLLNLSGGDQSTVGGGDSNTIEAGASWATIAGGQANLIQSTADNATIGGGSLNTIGIAGTGTTIAGGIRNTAGFSSSEGFLGGGSDNIILDDALAASIVGGRGNTNGATLSFIGGGDENSIDAIANGAAILGGSQNIILLGAENASIGGGHENTVGIGSEGSTIAGGAGNDINGSTFNAAIGGGEDNAIGDAASYAVIGGGFGNIITANALAATVGGGYQNTNRANFAIIPGGRDNVANAAQSFAAGTRAKANHTGAFVWGDSADLNVASSAPDQVTMRASGGYRLFSNTNLSMGVTLEPGSSSWSMGSDRNAKENFSAVDPRDILNRVSSLPLHTWNYKTQADGIRHLGPMAQDFRAAFGLGEDERHISAVDADGIALAAIQGLHALVQEKDAEIQALKDSVEELKALLQALQPSR